MFTGNTTHNANSYFNSNVYTAGNIVANANVYFTTNANIYASGNVIANGNSYFNSNIYTQGNIVANANVYFTTNANIYTSGNVVANGNVYFSANISANTDLGNTTFGNVNSNVSYSVFTIANTGIYVGANSTANLGLISNWQLQGNINGNISNATPGATIIALGNGGWGFGNTLHYFQSVRLATTANLLATYANGPGGNGIGSTLTYNSGNGTYTALVVDSVATNVNDRILVQYQTSNAFNGIYVVSNVGSNTYNWVMTRSTDYNQPNEILGSDIFNVTAGVLYQNQSFTQQNYAPVVGVSPIVFSAGGVTNLQTVTTAGNTTNVGITIANTLNTSYSNIQALVVTGGTGLNGNIVANSGFVTFNQALSVYANISSVFDNTDVSVTPAIGSIPTAVSAVASGNNWYVAAGGPINLPPSGGGAYLLRSQNLTNWQIVLQDVAPTWTSVKFLNNQFVYTRYYGSTGVFISNDNGNTFGSAGAGAPSYSRTIDWDGANYCAVFTPSQTSGAIARATPGVGAQLTSSTTWLNALSTTPLLFNILYNGSGIWMTVGQSGAVYTSTTGGSSWTTRTSNVTANLTSVAWTGRTFVAGGNVGTLITSTDGNNWSNLSFPSTANITSMAYNTVFNTLYAVTDTGGNIYRSTNQGVSWTTDSSGNLGSVYLASIYSSGDQMFFGGGNTANSSAYFPIVYRYKNFGGYVSTDSSVFKIYGGSANYILSTDGAGDLNWVPIPGGQFIANGNSSVAVYGNSNVTVSVGGNANTATFTTSAFITNGNVVAIGTGDFSGGNTSNANGYYFGNGSYLTGVPITNGNSNVVVYSNANVTISSNGISNTFIMAGNRAWLGYDSVGSGTVYANSYSPAPLTIVSSTTATQATQINLMQIGGGAGAGSQIDFYTYLSAGNPLPGSRIGSVDDGNYSANYSISTKTPGSPANTLVQRLVVTGSGNVIIANGVSFSTNNYLAVTRGATINTTQTDEYIKIGGNTAGNAGYAVVLGISSSNTTYAGLRWSKAQQSEVWFLGTDNSSANGNIILNGRGGTYATITDGAGNVLNSNLIVSTGAIFNNGFFSSYPQYVARAAQTTIPNSTDTSVAWTFADYNSLGSIVTANAGGNTCIFQNSSGRALTVSISYQVAWAANTSGARVGWVNVGNALSSGNRFGTTNLPTSPDFTVINGTTIIRFNPGDTWQLGIWQNSGSGQGQGGAYSGLSANNSTKLTLTILG